MVGMWKMNVDRHLRAESGGGRAKRFSVLLLLLIAAALVARFWLAPSRADEGALPPLALGADGYYEIATSADLGWFRDRVNAGSADINGRLTADIDLMNVQWTPIGSGDHAFDTSGNSIINGNLFSGSFDGAGHSVTGLYISRDADCHGFFGALATSADIRCLTVSGDVSSGPDHVGRKSYNTGLIAGFNCGRITDCTAVFGHITGTSAVGGIVGYNLGGQIINCVARGGVVSGTQNVGAVAGANKTGNIVINSSSQLDMPYANITNCVAVCDSVTGTDGYVGGIVGGNANGSGTWNAAAKVMNCTAVCWGVSGGSGSDVGGVAGYNGDSSEYQERALVKNCSSACTAVSGDAAVGGVVGKNDKASVTNCGWLDTKGLADGIGTSDNAISADIKSFDVSALNGTDGIVTTILPALPALKIRSKTSSARVAFASYPALSADLTRYISSDISALAIPNNVVSVNVSQAERSVSVSAGSTFGSGVLSSDFTMIPTWFSGGCADTSADSALHLSLLSAFFVDGSPLITTDAALVDGTLGASYSTQLLAEGLTPITWAVSGSLPEGLSLDVTNGIISGTPTKVGSYTFTARAKNDAGYAERVFTLKVNKVQSPSSGGCSAGASALALLALPLALRARRRRTQGR